MRLGVLLEQVLELLRLLGRVVLARAKPATVAVAQPHGATGGRCKILAEQRGVVQPHLRVGLGAHGAWTDDLLTTSATHHEGWRAKGEKKDKDAKNGIKKGTR